MSGDREGALRRIAIVLNSLPAAMATRLLGDLDADAKLSLRRAMTTLSDVDPLEQKRVLQAFSGSLRQQPAARSSEGDVFLASSASIAASVANPHSSPGTTASPSFADSRRQPNSASPPRADEVSPSHASLAFLADVEDDALVRLVVGEHPQTVALVLASVAPAQAARILPRLDPSLRANAMSRIGRLGEIPAEMIEELASHLRSRVSQNSPRISPQGQRRLHAILAAMPTDGDSATTSRHLQDAPTTGTANREAIAATTLRIDPATRLHADDEGAGISMSDGDDGAYQQLVELPPIELRELLASVETRDALLALCGLPTEVADAVIATLPRSQARQIRNQLNSIGSLQLRDIDRAMQRVAEARVPRVKHSTTHESARGIPLAA